jgi:ComF family protein
MLATAFTDVVAALFPAACRQCGRSLPPSESRPGAARPYAGLFDGSLRRNFGSRITVPLYLSCPGCALALRRARHAGRAAETECIAAFAPEASIFSLVHAFKYDGVRELAPWFGAFIARRVRCLHRDRLAGSILVPVPLHPARESERGYNQSALLAQAIGRRLGLPVDTGLIARRRATRPQAQLAVAARRTNVAAAFQRLRPLPAKTRIALVDDVVTSGATVHAVLAALGCEPRRAVILCICHAGTDTDSRPTAAAAVCVRSPAEP